MEGPPMLNSSALVAPRLWAREVVKERQVLMDVEGAVVVWWQHCMQNDFQPCKVILLLRNSRFMQAKQTQILFHLNLLSIIQSLFKDLSSLLSSSEYRDS